ncbi:MAG TPA: hypothetical protein VFA33_13260 [Bryobacteraceae bacterium]|nr:hypothetical protein [Bryobacteraceae bacterium]
MKVLLQAGLCCLLATGAFAQHRGMGGGFRTAPAGGFRGGHVGGGYLRGGVRYGGFGAGYYRHPGYFGRFGLFRRNGFYYPYAYSYPLYFGSWWPSDFSWPAYDYAPPNLYPAAAPNVTVVYPQQPVTSSMIVVPPYQETAVSPTAPPPSLAEVGRETSPLYLIAFQDHVIRAALAYWVSDSTLHYLDMDHKIRQAPLNTVDRDFSRQLNRERRVPFHLPEGENQ